MSDAWLKKVWEHMDRAFDSVWCAFDETFVPGERAEESSVGRNYHVVSNDETAIVITLDVPGVKRADIDVELIEENRLRIAGKREGRGSFGLKLRLTDIIDPDGISATLADGVLTITAKKLVPKAPAGRKIPIG
jgi:HSP20 family molecular chaperone IbpA